MKNSILLITAFLCTHFIAYGQASKEAPTPTIKLPEISKELISMRDRDQKYRRKWGKLVRKGKTKSRKYKRTAKTLRNIDRTNTMRIREIVEQYGWPTYELVGVRASNCAWLVVQHADLNPLVQIHCLPLLKEAVDQQQANPSNYAYLYDRVQVAKGEKQLYATQSTTNNGLKTGYFQPIEDESNVQKRRTEMRVGQINLSHEPQNTAPTQTIEAYAKELGFKYEVPSKEEAIQRDKAWAEAYQKNSKLAHQARKVNDFSAAIDHYYKALESHGHIKTEDYVELARLISISKHKRMSSAFYYLIKAAIRGWEGINEFNTNEDFKNIRLANPENWSFLMTVVEELNNKKAE